MDACMCACMNARARSMQHSTREIETERKMGQMGGEVERDQEGDRERGLGGRKDAHLILSYHISSHVNSHHTFTTHHATPRRPLSQCAAACMAAVQCSVGRMLYPGGCTSKLLRPQAATNGGSCAVRGWQ